MLLNREARYRRLLAAADVTATAFAIGLVAILGHERLKLATLIALAMVVLVSKLAGLYDRDELLIRKTTLDEAPALFRLATLYALLVWLLQDVFVEGSLGRLEVVGIWLTLFVAFVLARAAARRLAGALSPEERCLVVGSDKDRDRIAIKLAAEARTNARVVDHVDPGAVRIEAGKAVAASTPDEISRVLAAQDVHRVIIAPGSMEPDAMINLIGITKGFGSRVSVLPRLFEVVGSSVEFDRIGGVTLLGVRRFGLTRSSQAVKRGFDAAVSVAGLVVSLPVMVVIAIAIKLDSRGPVCFRQIRIGRDGEPFEMVKFRTMGVDAEEVKAELAGRNEADGLFKITDDPRVTRVGRVLRASSLDELPQLWNVLRGDMSLVGPRPLVVDEDRRVVGWHRRRLHITPGMTGHWQLLGATRVPLHEMTTIDYLYAANWSLWGDLKVLLRTLIYVLGRRGV